MSLRALWEGWTWTDWVTWVIICLAAGYARGYLAERWHRWWDPKVIRWTRDQQDK